jgi:hypothetical protein
VATARQSRVSGVWSQPVRSGDRGDTERSAGERSEAARSGESPRPNAIAAPGGILGGIDPETRAQDAPGRTLRSRDGVEVDQFCITYGWASV